MLRRIAGWLMGLMPCGDPGCALCAPRLIRREGRIPFACSIGWHRPGELRINGRHVPAECVERGCPIVTEIRSREQ